jgi:hypothetical protein
MQHRDEPGGQIGKIWDSDVSVTVIALQADGTIPHAG